MYMYMYTYGYCYYLIHDIELTY